MMRCRMISRCYDRVRQQPANATTFDFFTAVYQRYCDGDHFSNTFGDPLVELDTDFNLVPAAAESWEVSEDGRVWTFKLQARPGLE